MQAALPHCWKFGYLLQISHNDRFSVYLHTGAPKCPSFILPGYLGQCGPLDHLGFAHVLFLISWVFYSLICFHVIKPHLTYLLFAYRGIFILLPVLRKASFWWMSPHSLRYALTLLPGSASVASYNPPFIYGVYMHVGIAGCVVDKDFPFSFICD